MSLKVLIIGKEPFNKDERASYDGLKNIIGEYGHEVIGTPNDCELLDDFIDYHDTFNNIKDADLIIHEASQEGIRPGMELREADTLSKPVVVIVKEGTEISPLISGLPLLQDIIYYENLDNIRDGLVRNLAIFEETDE